MGDTRITAAFRQAAAKTAAQGSAAALREVVAAIRARAFKQQLWFIDDPFDRKVLLCPRRAGKTDAAAALIVLTCLQVIKARVIYISITRGVAKRNIWGHLKELDEAYRLGVNWNNTELIGTFPSGSTITVAGAESQDDVDKFRGTAFDLIVIDECKSFAAPLLAELVTEVLEPCLADTAGTLVMMGTPGATLAGPFFEASCEASFMIRDGVDAGRPRYARSRPFRDREDGRWRGVGFEWSFHGWTTGENAARPDIWGRILERHKASGQSDDDPRWIREWLGRWVADDTAFVYKYNAAGERCSWEPGVEPWEPKAPDNPWGLPRGHEWHFVAGVDLGYDDDFDIEVAAYSDTHPDFFHVDGYASPGLTIGQMAMKIREIEEIFGGFDLIVGDRGGLGKTIFASLDDTYGVHVEPADKNDKRDFIELLNSDLLAGRCHVIANSTLARQMSVLQWDDKKRHEDKAFPNHACDAFVYIWRHVFHHLAVARPKIAMPGTVEWAREMERQEVERVLAKRRARRELDYFEGEHRLDDTADEGQVDWEYDA